jgi:hypothetical protein
LRRKCLGNCFGDAVIRAATAKIAAHALAQLIVAELDRRGGQVLGDHARHTTFQLRRHCYRRAKLPRCAVAALKPIMVEKGALQRMQRPSTSYAFDRSYGTAFILHGQREASIDPFAISQHRAGSAGALVAAFLRPGQPEMVA